ncbi:hypothetical protein LS73_003635 [Helicobacter muridarum]|uniref:MORN repeat variant n=1 Tax=Helicobacter muridarum TaxID=216 RepID=A0A377PUL7_9HELI|nr:hypothetical protein [Helicobacter muridarum]TLE00754.1 hypothetical protein LS73_003635 [Helicobacter muridarum]STQ86566.1 Uncharacterised protein [Helicobacter muridarum]
MKKLNFAIVGFVLLASVLWFRIASQSNDVKVYVNYSTEDKNEIISKTSYLSKDDDGYFVICQSRDGEHPCHKVSGVRHGVEKWYSHGALKYEDFYDNGILLATNSYYDNGFISQEVIYKNGNIAEKRVYSRTVANELVKKIFYTTNEIIKRYYVSGKLVKEEIYKGKYLVSRKIFNKNGLLKRLEDYSSSNDTLELLSPFLHGNEDIPSNQNQKHQREEHKRHQEYFEGIDSLWV